VTEAEWNSETDSNRLLLYLHGKATDRTYRLFACACCRRVWHLLTDARSQEAVEAAERFADGQVTPEAVLAFREAAQQVAGPKTSPAVTAAICTTQSVSRYAALGAAMHTSRAAALSAGRAVARVSRHEAAKRALADERRLQCDLVRCLSGNPFRPVSLDPAWLAWNGGTVRRLAEAAYQDRKVPDGTLDAARLAVLADALEEAGCGDAEVLGHLRRPGQHIRGCWVLDLLLNKE
jgi:hypothetical protein